MSLTTQSTEPTTKKCEAKGFIIPVVTVLTIAITSLGIILIFGGVIGSVTFGGFTIKQALGFS